jgi:hypothetical protein
MEFKGSAAIGTVGFGIFLLIVAFLLPDIPPWLITLLFLITVLMMLYGVLGFVHSQWWKPKKWIADPGREFITTKLSEMKAFLAEEQRLGTGIDGNDPPSHPKEFTTIADTYDMLKRVKPKWAEFFGGRDDPSSLNERINRLEQLLDS